MAATKERKLKCSQTMVIDQGDDSEFLVLPEDTRRHASGYKRANFSTNSSHECRCTNVASFSVTIAVTSAR